jgi:DNA polymerase III delta subunit
MMYLFYGSDVEKVRAKAFDWVAAARKKEPALAYVRLAREELSDATLEDAALSGGLFVKRLLILIDDPFPSTRAKSEDSEDEEEASSSVLEEHIDELAASDNAILILAPKLAAAKAKKLAAKAKMEYKYDKPAARADARGFNSGLVNALAARSRDKLWLEINRSLIAGDAPEMLHGLLHWKARDLMEKGSRAWSAEESRQLSLALIELLQNSRRGGLDLSLSLERFALTI